MTKSKVEVAAAQERAQMGVQLYVLALIALARQLQEDQDQKQIKTAQADEEVARA
jgi:hypothetical protein